MCSKQYSKSKAMRVTIKQDFCCRGYPKATIYKEMETPIALFPGMKINVVSSWATDEVSSVHVDIPSGEISVFLKPSEFESESAMLSELDLVKDEGFEYY